MVPKLYYTKDSPSARATLLTINALGIDVELKLVNLAAGEHLTAEFLKLNPIHTVPTLEDGDFVLWDSHAINTYLVGKYGKNDFLYPEDLKKRAIIDNRLYFDCGVIFRRMQDVVVPFIVQDVRSASKETALIEAYSYLETFLERSTYVAGEELSLADFSIIATITTANTLIPISPELYPKISKWIARMQALPYYGVANQPGVEIVEKMINSKLVKPKTS